MIDKLIRIHTDPHDCELGEYVYRSEPTNGGQAGMHNWDFFHEVGEGGARYAQTLGGWEFIFDASLQLWLRIA